MKTGLILLAAACVVLGGFRAAAAQEGAVPQRPGPETLAASETVELQKLLPSPGEIAGWKADGEPLTYTEENLWQYIDGSAENFIAFRFRQVLTQDYVSTDGKGLKVEIYEHESPLMAYGIYAQMRSPGLALHKIGNEAFSDDYSLNFWKGRFYVRVAVFEKGAGLERVLEDFAGAIAAKIAKGGALPAEATVFPEEGLVPNDTKYLTQGILGREKFPAAFVGTYRVGDEEAKLYLSPLPDSAAAQDTFEWYVSQMKSYRAAAQGANNEYTMGLASDPFQGDELVLRSGRFFGVLTGLKDPLRDGADLMKRMVERLEEIKADKMYTPPPAPKK
ncbi:MAG TPA: DUF6599 family protein [Candidatus Bathyarchaeia archaeon]|nr:DUF6599 family protein [Candidatus Bathyarchaeia archaeon]